MCDFLSRFPLLTTVTKTSFQSLPHLSPLDICPPFCQNVLASTLHRTGSSSSSSFSFSISSPDVPVGHNLPCFSLSYTPPPSFSSMPRFSVQCFIRYAAGCLRSSDLTSSMRSRTTCVLVVGTTVSHSTSEIRVTGDGKDPLMFDHPYISYA